MKSLSLKIATAFTPLLLLAGCASTGASSTDATLGALANLAGISGTTAPASNLGTLSGLGSLVGLGGTPAVATVPAYNASTIGSPTGMGNSVLKTFINQQCQTQLQNNNYWKIASVAMGADRQAQIANNVCGCVTEKAPQSITVNDMATVALNPSARTQIVGTAVARTLQSCTSQFLQ